MLSRVGRFILLSIFYFGVQFQPDSVSENTTWCQKCNRKVVKRKVVLRSQSFYRHFHHLPINKKISTEARKRNLRWQRTKYWKQNIIRQHAPASKRIEIDWRKTHTHTDAHTLQMELTMVGAAGSVETPSECAYIFPLVSSIWILAPTCTSVRIYYFDWINVSSHNTHYTSPCATTTPPPIRHS